ncbi:MAG TPA: hypothetical protein VFC19_06745 [Candidatus Limnocylindrales bacterium]|nr:hypothetical protein [Candidatus Limnocylindrales bacterium]
MLWLLLVLSLGLEAWLRLARRPPPIMLPRPMRILAAGMLGTSVVTLTTAAHASPPAASLSTANHPTTHRSSGHAAPVHNAARPVPAHAGTGNPDVVQDQPDADRPASIHTQRAVDLPGGWIVWPVAAGILAATAITLLRSRITLAPASALLRAIRAVRHRVSDPDSQQPHAAVGDDIAVLEQDANTVLPLTIGLRGATEIGIDSLPSNGVGVTGPGSTDALRGILAAAATCTSAAIVMSADLLHTLTGTHPPLPGITMTKDTHTAMHTIQMEIHRRYTLTPEPTKPTAKHRHPPLLLLIEPVSDSRRLAALAELGSHHNIRIVVAGQWHAGATWSVDRHGHTRSGTTAVGRINMLNPEALTQITHELQPLTEHTANPAQAAPPSSQPSAPFHLRILGALQLTTASHPAIHIRRSDSRQIAVYLALHPDGATRDDLLEHIFGHMTMASATTSLDSCLYELRRLLTIDGHSALVRLDDQYRLDPQLVAVDWWQLLHHLQRGDLTQATAHYTGHIADGHTWDWLPEYRQNTRHLIADAHATLTRTVATPNHALTHALAGINIDPYSTACYDTAISAYMQLDQPDHAQALREEKARRLI